MACTECPPKEICPSQLIKRLPDSRQVQIIARDGCYGCLACVTACFFEAVWSDWTRGARHFAPQRLETEP